MATKPKVTSETASKEVQAAAPTEKITGAKTKKSVAAPQEPATEAPNSSSVKAVSKSKPHPQIVSAVEPEVTPSEAPAEKMHPKVPEETVSPTGLSGTPQDKKWREIKLILEKLKEDTLREIRKSVKNGTEAVAAIEPGGDIYDQASSERDRELGLLLGDREREKIHSIDEALLRIDEGDYGICEECDEDIPLGRLKAMPFTRHCVKCKSDLEKLQAQTKRVEEERAYREIPLGSSEEEE
jgi:DnaK suppressor protein